MKTFSRRCANWLSGGSSRTESTLASQGLSWFSLHPPSHPSGGLRKALLKMQSIPPISVHIPGTNPLSQDRWREMEAGLPDAGLREGFAALCLESELGIPRSVLKVLTKTRSEGGRAGDSVRHEVV